MPFNTPAKRLFFQTCVRRYILTEDELNFFGLENSLIPRFNNRKYATVEALFNYDFNFISLGSDCRAKSYTTTYLMEELALPQKPFDRSITPPTTVYNMLKNDFKDYRATDIFKSDTLGNYFINSDLDITFIHDHLTLDKPVAQSIDFFNNTVIPKRIENFYNQINENTIFFMFVPKRFIHHLDIVDKLEQLIKDRFNAKLLVAYDGIEDDIIENSKVAKLIRPREDYIWHLPEYFVTPEGFQYEGKVVERIVSFIQSNFEPVARATTLEEKFARLTKKNAKFHLVGGDFFLESGNRSKAEQCIQHAIKANDATISHEIIAFQKKFTTNPVYIASNMPLQYSSANACFDFDPAFWEEHRINGLLTLIVKPGQWLLGRYATMKLYHPLVKGKFYQLYANFSIKTQFPYINFHLKSSGTNINSIIKKINLTEIQKQGTSMISITHKFKCPADIFDEFKIAASQLTGANNFIAFKDLAIQQLS